jgi:hypothetical protein
VYYWRTDDLHRRSDFKFLSRNYLRFATRIGKSAIKARHYASFSIRNGFFEIGARSYNYPEQISVVFSLNLTQLRYRTYFLLVWKIKLRASMNRLTVSRHTYSFVFNLLQIFSNYTMFYFATNVLERKSIDFKYPNRTKTSKNSSLRKNISSSWRYPHTSKNSLFILFAWYI